MLGQKNNTLHQPRVPRGPMYNPVHKKENIDFVSKKL
jgi:hypothetical protein